ncbi:uncharacterized protein METZ01_LOCUS150839, partial [marine metagenome]
MEFLSNYGLFLAKTVTLLAALLAVVGFIATLAMRRRSATPEHIEVKPINDRYRDISDVLQHSMLHENEAKKKRKADKKARKAEAKKTTKQLSEPRKRLFILDFQGDLRGSEVATLREEVTAVLLVARDQDEVLLRLESTGGMVHAYGLAASQLSRIRE